MQTNIFNKLGLDDDLLLLLNIKGTEELKHKFNKEKLTIGDLFYNEKTNQYFVFFLKDVFVKNYFERGKFSGFSLYGLKPLIDKSNHNEEYYSLSEDDLRPIIDKNLASTILLLKDLKNTSLKLDYMGNLLKSDSGIGLFFNQKDFYVLINIVESMKAKLNDLMFFYIKNDKMTSVSYDNLIRNSAIFSFVKKRLKKNELQFSFLIYRDIFVDSIMISQKNSNRFFLSLNKYGLLDMITPHFINGAYDSVNAVLDEDDIKQGYDIYHLMFEDEYTKKQYKENLFDLLYELS